MVAITPVERVALALFALLVIPLLLLGFQRRQSLSAGTRRALAALLAGTVILFGAWLAQVIYRNIAAPPVFDVQAFWLYGRVAASGENFYSPSVFHEAGKSLNLDAWAAHEILDVGFPYPPPTVFLVLPLGWMDLQTAALAWNALHTVCLVASIVMLWRTFMDRTGLWGLALVAALVLSFRPTPSTFSYGQTNFLVLLLLTLCWRVRTRSRAGAYLAQGMLVKPYLGFLLAYFLLRAKWRVLWVAAATLAFLSLLVIAVFGPTTFLSYFTDNPSARMPYEVYVGWDNPSMLGTILRYIPHSGGGPPVTHPVFLLSAAIVTGLTLWVMWRLDPARAELGLVLAVPAALLLYPATGGHYAVVCLVPYLYLWSHREALGLSLGIVVEFIATQYVFFALAYGPIVTIGLILQWLFLAVLGSGLSVRKATAAITGPPGWIEGSHSALP